MILKTSPINIISPICVHLHRPENDNYCTMSHQRSFLKSQNPGGFQLGPSSIHFGHNICNLSRDPVPLSVNVKRILK